MNKKIDHLISIKSLIALLISMGVGIGLTYFLISVPLKWHYSSLLIYIPIYFAYRRAHPPMSKAMRVLLKNKNPNHEEVKKEIRELGKKSSNRLNNQEHVKSILKAMRKAERHYRVT